MLYLIYLVRCKCSYGYHGFGFLWANKYSSLFLCCMSSWANTFPFEYDASIFSNTFSSLHTSRCAVLFPSELKQLKFCMVFLKLLNTQDQLLEVVPVPYKCLSCILIAIVLNIRAFFPSSFWKVNFFLTIPMLLKIFYTFRFNLCENSCVYI